MACRNYPFAFVQDNKSILVTWARDAEKTCAGIGKGTFMKKKELERRAEKTLDLITEHNNVVDEINQEALSGHPLSIREALLVLIAYGEKKPESNL